MELDPGEVQIVKGAALTVTDKRIVYDQGEIAVANVSAPQVEEIEMKVSAGNTVIAIGAVLVLGGMLVEPFASFVVPTLYCAYLEFRLHTGARFGVLNAIFDNGLEEVSQVELPVE